MADGNRPSVDESWTKPGSATGSPAPNPDSLQFAAAEPQADELSPEDLQEEDPPEEELTPVISIEAPPGRPSEEQPRPRLGHYEILQSIGSGGMAEVFLARNVGPMGFEKIVVLKCIHPHLAKEKHFVTMFLDEARIAARIHDPRVCQIYELGDSAGTYYMAMEYLAGESLSTVVKTAIAGGPALPHHLVARVIADVCLGLHAAHELRDAQGKSLEVVHRDVSHANICVLYSGAVKVLDFGVAKARDSLQQTSAGERKGKYGYMSPEQVQGTPIDRRSDVFSLGVVLWEALTHQRLFSADSELETVRRVIEGVPPVPSTLVRDIPPALDAIVLKALAKDRNERYQTAEDMAVALEAYIRQTGLAAGMTEVAAFMKVTFAERMQQRAKLVRLGKVKETELPLAIIETTPSREATELKQLRKSRTRMRVLLAALGASALLAAAYYIGRGRGEDSASRPAVAQRPPEPAPAPPAVEEPPLPDRSLVDSMLDRASIAIAAGRVAAPPGDNALELLLDIEKQDPGNQMALELRARAVEALVASAQLLWDAGKKESARGVYADILLFDPNHPLAKERGQARVKTAVGKSQAASPDEIAWIITEIDLAIIERRLIAPPGRNALEYLQRLRKLDPKHEAARRLGGEVSAALVKESKAKPEDAKELVAAAKVANGGAVPISPPEKDEVEKARDPLGANKHVANGNKRLASGQLSEARRDFERAITADSSSHSALAGLAEVAYNESDYTRAVLAAKRAIALAPRNGQYRMLLGKSYYKLLRYQDAITQWEKARDLDPSNTAAQKNIEMAQRRMGNDH